MSTALINTVYILVLIVIFFTVYYYYGLNALIISLSAFFVFILTLIVLTYNFKNTVENKIEGIVDKVKTKVNNIDIVERVKERMR